MCEKNELIGFRVHPCITQLEASARFDLTTESAEKLVVGTASDGWSGSLGKESHTEFAIVLRGHTLETDVAKRISSVDSEEHNSLLTPTVDAAPTAVLEHVALAQTVYAALAAVVEHTAPAPAVYAALVVVVEYTALPVSGFGFHPCAIKNWEKTVEIPQLQIVEELLRDPFRARRSEARRLLQVWARSPEKFANVRDVKVSDMGFCSVTSERVFQPLHPDTCTMVFCPSARRPKKTSRT